MPLDPSLSLQVQPVKIDTPDPGKLFLTLSQMKYLNSETQRTAVQAQAAQEEAARKQTTFGEQGAAGQYLSSIGQAPPGPSAGGQPLAPGTPPAPGGAVDLTHPTILAGIRAIAPHVAEDVIKGLYERKDQEAKLKTQQLAALNTTLETGAKVMGGARDEPSYQLALGVLKELKADVSVFPPHWDPERGPALAKAFAESTRTTQERIAQAHKELELSENLVVKGFPRDILVPRFPGRSPGPGPAGSGTQTPIPGTEPPMTGEETKAAANLTLAAQSNARLAGIEANIAAHGTDPSLDPTRDITGVYLPDPTGKLGLAGFPAQTPAERQREIQQYLLNTGANRWEKSVIDTGNGPPPQPPDLKPTNAPNTYTGKGLIRVVPSVTEHALANNAGGVTSAVGAAVGGAVGSLAGPGVGTAVGGAVGSATGAGVGPTVSSAANKLLDPRRQAYYGEQLNFIAAVRGEETSRLSPETIEIERKRYFPSPGDTEAEVLRKRQVREDALSAMQTRTNRPQGTVPIGQTRETPAAPAAAGPKVFTMEQAWATSRAYGRPVEDVVREAKQQGWTLK
jgi:hypothetical protein